MKRILTRNTRERTKIKRVLVKFRRYFPVYLMALPCIIYIFINNYMPLPGIVLAFKKYSSKKGIWGSDWTGLKNFEYLFKTQDAWVITRNTLGYNFLFIGLNLVLSIAVAIILSELVGKQKKIYQSCILLPHMISMVIVSYLVYAFLCSESGFVNNTILPLFNAEPVSWYTEKKYWPFILTFVHIWKGIGYSCIVYLAAILGIDRSIYEAASIDGASKIQQIFRITIPLLKPTIIMLILMSIGRIFYSDFGLFYQVPMNTGILLPVTQTIDTYVYRGLLERNDIARSAAASVFQSLVGFVLVMSANLAVKKIDPESALF